MCHQLVCRIANSAESTKCECETVARSAGDRVGICDVSDCAESVSARWRSRDRSPASSRQAGRSDKYRCRNMLERTEL